jgi:hypothetical protein
LLFMQCIAIGIDALELMQGFAFSNGEGYQTKSEDVLSCC